MLRHLGDLIEPNSPSQRGRIALSRTTPSQLSPLSYAELARQAQAFSLGLRNLGVSAGDRVGIFSDNSARWLVTDLGSLKVGAVTVPRGADTDGNELKYILGHSNCGLLVVQNARLLKTAVSLRSSLGSLTDLIVLDPDFNEGDPDSRIFTFDQILEGGGDGDSSPTTENYRGPDRGDLATIVYTSGTTGQPKGVMLSHGNILHNVESFPTRIDVGPNDKFLSILPSWHMFERTVEYCLLAKGACIVYTDKRRFKKDLQDERPTLLCAVPRLWELIHTQIVDAIEGRGDRAKRIAAYSLKTGRAYRRALRTLRGQKLLLGENPPPPPSFLERTKSALQLLFLSPGRLVADRFFFRKVRGVTGGNLKIAISGGGALCPQVEEFFDAIGIPILNGYGLTETSPIISVRDPRNNLPGTIGLPLPETDVEVRDEKGRPLPEGSEGVLCVKGPQIMQGYYQRRDATEEVLSNDGWFNTGDLGRIARGGHLVFTGRSKDTIVLSSGENVQPGPIEKAIGQSSFVEHCVVVGQDQRQLGALIEPSLKTLENWAKERGVGHESTQDLLENDAVIELLGSELNRISSVKNGFRAFEVVRNFRILPDPLTVENGALTQTLKVKRKVVMDRYQELIGEMY